MGTFWLQSIGQSKSMTGQGDVLSILVQMHVIIIQAPYFANTGSVLPERSDGK
jgi:hypothetical protein